MSLADPGAAPTSGPAWPRGALPFSIAATAFVGVLVTIIWAAAGGGYYWPCWVWLGALIVVAPPAIDLHVRAQPPGARRWIVAHADTAVAVAGCVVLVWCFAGASGPFWPMWVIVGLLALLGAHALIVYGDRLPAISRTRALSERVDTLARTRRGALDVQALQLQRIERDLHDGAQARLVALSMQLGRAEARLAADPETAALVHAARVEAGAAIAELRDLARGIAPPVLADRGLVAAVRSLADRSPVPVAVTDDTPPDRLPPVVENAAYFVVAEALTNVAKHAPGAAASVTLTGREQTLVIDVSDNGPGGADARSRGLDGLRARVEALDGTFTVVSPHGGPTAVHAELPCES